MQHPIVIATLHCAVLYYIVQYSTARTDSTSCLLKLQSLTLIFITTEGTQENESNSGRYWCSRVPWSLCRSSARQYDCHVKWKSKKTSSKFKFILDLTHISETSKLFLIFNFFFWHFYLIFFLLFSYSVLCILPNHRIAQYPCIARYSHFFATPTLNFEDSSDFKCLLYYLCVLFSSVISFYFYLFHSLYPFLPAFLYFSVHSLLSFFLPLFFFFCLSFILSLVLNSFSLTSIPLFIYLFIYWTLLPSSAVHFSSFLSSLHYTLPSFPSILSVCPRKVWRR